MLIQILGINFINYLRRGFDQRHGDDKNCSCFLISLVLYTQLVDAFQD